MAILQTIVQAKKKEVSSLPSLSSGHSIAVKRGFINALLKSDRSSIIAEIKPKSPSKGFIIKRSAVPSIVSAYNKYADAISVLCDREFFGGGFDLLDQVRLLTEKPILAKEFIISQRQIEHVAAHGADAVLLIAAILTEKELIDFASTASRLGLDILLEVHNKKEIESVANVFHALPKLVQDQILIGINNRNLDTLEIDLSITRQLAPFVREKMPSIRGIIAESGIDSSKDVSALQPFVQGFLIGTSILRSASPEQFLSSLQGPVIRVKYCGMTNMEDVLQAEELGVDYLGFIFVPSSPRSIQLQDALALRKNINHAKVVGVFMDMPLQEIRQHVIALNLDYVQLHGKPDIEICKQLKIPVIQAFGGVPSQETLEQFLKVCPYVLIDKAKGENEVDLDTVASLPSAIRSRLFLAGGLTVNSVKNAVQTVHPFAVDCARGIENNPGKKDPKLMNFFIRNLNHI